MDTCAAGPSTGSPQFGALPNGSADQRPHAGRRAQDAGQRLVQNEGQIVAADVGKELRSLLRRQDLSRNPERQEIARAFGADVVVDYTQGDSVEQILELTGGEGVDAAIEAFGFPQTWDAAIRVTKPGGRISNIGYHGENPEPLEVPLEPFGMGMSDKQIYGGLCPGGSERLGRIFRLMQTGKVDPTPMTTHEFGFDEIETAFKMMQEKEDGIIKPLIHFN